MPCWSSPKSSIASCHTNSFTPWSLYQEHAEIAYATAARAVRRLIEQRGVDALVALLEDLRRGAPFARAFDQRIAMPHENFAALGSRD